MNNTQTISISELRQNATGAINRVVDSQRPVVIVTRSKPKAVLVDFNYFNSLEEAIMDLTDAAEAERAKKEPKREFNKYLAERFKKQS
ncbi:hypothetical protein A2690_01345 [Candidatus Roizmanbacteria bacterium RIFCSPHIGHO2_01_FULL_39_12b]|uniref:Antitoxin n=1 Tax=Candidatus Roizmanbacteria bacterium RIFCSPHIGHO2_01_FULL_39_12b TaxID=1802030 RepID=A0A1F7GB09_9BACT|nr:MAG: hypothetical protein A2690_01345 [Candidatus Roizmanbacteria bacterium RIFCSPHIGHO2_01_FULL_39_12b]OGK46085.1 MAG: hypothetical protein A3B46_01250 [Candidatus Roizmanbacteria bacterium RIFCSPLOWO2_01_FULL_39_19]